MLLSGVTSALVLAYLVTSIPGKFTLTFLITLPCLVSHTIVQANFYIYLFGQSFVAGFKLPSSIVLCCVEVSAALGQIVHGSCIVGSGFLIFAFVFADVHTQYQVQSFRCWSDVSHATALGCCLGWVWCPSLSNFNHEWAIANLCQVKQISDYDVSQNLHNDQMKEWFVWVWDWMEWQGHPSLYMYLGLLQG